MVRTLALKSATIRQPKEAVLMGKPYSIEQLQELLASLTSTSPQAQMGAVVDYAKHSNEISAKIDETPNVSKTEFVDLVVAAVIKNQEELLKKLENERKKHTLLFIAKSSCIPDSIRKKARAALRRLQVDKLGGKLLTPVASYTPQQVNLLVQKLDSANRQMRMSAAIEFVQNYPRVVPTVSRMPMLTVTAVSTKACNIIEKNANEVFRIMAERKMVPELIFLSSLRQVPLPLRKKAEQIAAEIKDKETPLEMIAPHPLPAAPKPKAEPSPKAELGAPKKEAAVDAVVRDLKSPDTKKAVAAAIRFLRHYDSMVEAIAQKPMLTVTKVTDMAMKVISSNVSTVLSTLEKSRDTVSLNFLATSSKVPAEVSKRATEMLAKLKGPADKSSGFKKQ